MAPSALNSGWTDERRARQAAMMRDRKPWLRSTGPRSVQGKARSSQNALKHGARGAEIKAIRRSLRESRAFLTFIRDTLRAMARLRQAGTIKKSIFINALSGRQPEDLYSAPIPLKTTQTFINPQPLGPFMLKTFRRHFKNAKRTLRERRKIIDEARAIAARAAGHAGPKIFIDCGFNQGKVMALFARHLPDFTFYGFEANSNFKPQAAALKGRYKNVRDLNFAAVSVSDGETSFFLAGANKGAHIQEGSTMIVGKDAHQTDFTKPTIVPTVDFSNWLKNLTAANGNAYVALKMDIEGAEYDVLEDMFARDAIGDVDYLMVEFHSYCFTGDDKTVYQSRENALLDQLQKRKLTLSRWI
jgi:FkbM family methyltransferase